MKVTETRLDTLIDNLNTLICEDDLLTMQISLLVINSLDLTLNHFIVWRLHVVQVLIMLIQKKNFSISIVNNLKLRKSCQLPLQSCKVTSSIC